MRVGANRPPTNGELTHAPVAAACLGAFFGTPVTGALLVAELLKAPALVLPSLIAAVLARALLQRAE